MKETSRYNLAIITGILHDLYNYSVVWHRMWKKTWKFMQAYPSDYWDTQFLFAQSSYLLGIVYYFVFEIVNLYVVRRQQPSPLPIEQMSLKSKLLVRKIYLSSRHGASLLRFRYLSSGAFVNYWHCVSVQDSKATKQRLRYYTPGKGLPHVKCYNCNEKGHLSQNCPQPKVE